MTVVTQVVSLLLSLVSIGQAIKTDATKFDKITFTIVSILFLFLSVLIGEVL